MKLNPMCFVVAAPRANDSIKVGEEIFLIETRSNNNECARDRIILMEKNSSLDYIIEYESIYKDKYRYVYSKNVQEKI